MTTRAAQNFKPSWRETAIGTAAFFGLWYLVALLGIAPAKFFPMPHEVLAKLVALTHTPFAGATLQTHLLSSLHRYAMGFLLAVAIGLPLGLLMGRFRWLDTLVTPLFDALRFIAPVAWVPFAALWFGTGIGGPTLIIFAGAFPPILINAYRGARGVDPRFLEAASMLGIGSFKTITEVLFPAAIPSIIAGLRVGAGLGWMSLVGAELIAANRGVGYLIVKGQSAVDTPTVMAGMIAIGAVGVVIDVVLRRIEKHLLRHRKA